jgi:L-arabinose isomerase
MTNVFDPIKAPQRARIGLYSAGLHAYWDQFPGLRDRLIDYGRFIEQGLSAWGDVHNFGLVDTEG